MIAAGSGLGDVLGAEAEEAVGAGAGIGAGGVAGGGAEGVAPVQATRRRASAVATTGWLLGTVRRYMLEDEATLRVQQRRGREKDARAKRSVRSRGTGSGLATEAAPGK